MIGIEHSRRWRLRGGVCAALLAACTSGGSAQLLPGDVIADGRPGLVAWRGGVRVATLGPPNIIPVCVEMGADNASLLVMLNTPAQTPARRLIRVDANGVSTTLFGFSSGAFQFAVDDTGDAFALVHGAPRSSLMRVSPSGVVTTLPFGPSNASWIELDRTTGHTIAGDWLNVRSYDLLGNIVSSGIMFPWRTAFCDAVHDMRTGLTLFFAESGLDGTTALMSFDPSSATITSMMLAPPSHAIEFTGLAYDRKTDTFLAGGWGQLPTIVRVTRGSVASPVAADRGTTLAVWGQRHIVASNGAPRVGASFGLALREPAEPNAFYVAAASLAPRPGIQTPAGIVDLQPDALFALSLSNPALFRGFTGQLDVVGDASAAIAVPPFQALRGTRFFVSFVTIRGGRVASIANTAAFTIG